jgi:hypothetical protein
MFQTHVMMGRAVVDDLHEVPVDIDTKNRDEVPLQFLR